MKITYLDFMNEQTKKVNDALRDGRVEQATQYPLASIAEAIAAIADHLEENDDAND